MVANPPAISKPEHYVQPRLVPAVRVGLVFEEACTDAFESTFGWVTVLQDSLPIVLVDRNGRVDILGLPLVCVRIPDTCVVESVEALKISGAQEFEGRPCRVALCRRFWCVS